MERLQPGFRQFFWRITACHMVTYMAIGLVAFFAMDYAEQAREECSVMVDSDSPRVILGPALQVFRGLILAICLYPFRQIFLEDRWGWLKLWGLFIGLSILSTAGPAPGSIEGMIYTKSPVIGQVIGLWEVVLQTLLLSILFTVWNHRPSRSWNIIMGFLVGLVFMMSIGGVVSQPLS